MDAHALWAFRAEERARRAPEHRVSVTGVLQLLPCAGNVPVDVFGADVPAAGNCLYHAVWTAAGFAGIQQPFGLNRSQHVFRLRTEVAEEVVRLFRGGKLYDPFGHDPLHVGNLVAMPNQYLEYSGIVPITAMATMLRRRIVTLCADGVFVITPIDLSSLVGTTVEEDPVVIYHCQAGRVADVVPFGQWNHYVAVSFRTGEDKRRFASYIEVQVQAQVQRGGVSPQESRSGGHEAPIKKARKHTSPGRTPQKRQKTRSDGGQRPKEDDLAALIADATQIQELTKTQLDVLSRNFTKHPRLALLYFHCCSTDPATCVFSDETLQGPDSGKTVDRLKNNLDEPVGAETASYCQERVQRSSSSAGDLWACASCCEILNTVEDCVRLVPLDKLHPGFVLTPVEAKKVDAKPLWVVEHHLQVFRHDGKLYFLNPELVHDINSITLCGKCAENPRKSDFSLACGHDYGRPGDLRELGDVAAKCIAPVRAFKVEIAISGKHSIGHSICFPSTGPVECSKVLPHSSSDCIPRVTFVGPREQWKAKQSGYKHLYQLPVEEMYAWMRLLTQTHSCFVENKIKVDTSENAKSALRSLEASIDDAVSILESDEAKSIDEATISERFGDDYNMDDADSTPIISKSAVLKNVDGLDASVKNAAIEAMVALLNSSDCDENTPVVSVRRGEDPITEWHQNGNMIAAAFPCLFINGGKFLPHGTWPTPLIKHLMRYYDGRFEKNSTLVATLFNQLQRHTAIRRAAQIGSSRANVLVRMGRLVNSEEFRDALVQAKTNPDSSQAKRLNAHLIRLLSLVGGCVPFSPFERTTTRPKIAAMRAHYGIPLHWVTVAPPEHHDLELLRVAVLRELNAWNCPDVEFQHSTCTQDDLSQHLGSSSRARLSVSNMFPALSARVSERCVKQIYNDIILCRVSSDTRVSQNYSQRQAGAYGTIAAHAAVVEPQADGRLHIHMALYGSKFNPVLLSRIMCCPELCDRAAKWLESVCCTGFDDDVHEWRRRHLAQNGTLPKAFEITLPKASDDFKGFLKAAQMRAAATNYHSHTSTCFKGIRGKYMCRLSRPAGVHEDITCPLIVVRERMGNAAAGVTPIVAGHKLSRHVLRAIDDGYSYNKGEAFRSHTEGPLVWELRRTAANSSVVETNLLLAALTASHTNSSFINGEDSGDLIEEYMEAYMTKVGAALQGATTALLSAIDHNRKYPSRAEDSQSELRMGKYLATRTINSFSGAHEWSHALMVYAITGHRSFISSDTFWYIFPFALVDFAQRLASGSIDERQTAPEHEDERTIEAELARLVDEVNDDNSNPAFSRQNGGGARAFRVDGQIVFVSQAESYYHRGNHFKDFSPMEVECVIDVLPVKKDTCKTSCRGRPAREGFCFAQSHPLFNSHCGYVRAKMLTPVFGGAPPPTWSNSATCSKDAAKRDKLARYLLCSFTPWDENGLTWPSDARGLLALCDAWDRSTAPLINRERCRYIRNLMKKGYRSSRKEQIATDWRNRGADYWKNTQSRERPQRAQTPQGEDCEFTGVLAGNEDLYTLLTAAAAGSSKTRASVSSLRTTFSSLFPDAGNSDPIGSPTNPIRPFTTLGVDKRQSLAKLATLMQSFVPGGENITDETASATTTTTTPGNLSGAQVNESCISPCNLSCGQLDIAKAVLDGMDGHDGQTLTIAHGGGGTGKSYVVRRISDELHRRGYKVVSTCPTGAGACQLNEGRTFHSAMKFGKRGTRLSAQSAAALRQLFSSRVKLVVVDEMSMLKADFLVLLDERLRELYDANKPFGGMSILLTGDFFQLPVPKGTSLCKCMYMKTNSALMKRARNLFSLFTVFKLRSQQRASGCQNQQSILDRFRTLPTKYPAGNRWGFDDGAYRPIDKNLVDRFTRPLTQKDIVEDERWFNGSTMLVTSNMDRAVLNTCMASELARRNQQLLFRWRKPLLDSVPDAVQELLYNETEQPELFGYFVFGAPGQILDNANGNVTLGVANGTRCWYESMGWDDNATTQTVLGLIEEALQNGNPIVELPSPPDFINVKLADREGAVLNGSQWPDWINLDETWELDDSGRPTHKKSVIVPIGPVKSNGENYSVKVGASRKEHKPIHYEQHAVDLAMALTVWKAQGSTFDRVVVLLEGATHAPAWQFEHMYVAISRVRTAESLRCFPLSTLFDRDPLYNLRPSVFTVKWLMDLDNDGHWNSPSK